MILSGKTTKEKLKKIETMNSKTNTVNWCRTDPSLFDKRQLLSQEQLLNYWKNISKHKAL